MTAAGLSEGSRELEVNRGGVFEKRVEWPTNLYFPRTSVGRVRSGGLSGPPPGRGVSRHVIQAQVARDGVQAAVKRLQLGVSMKRCRSEQVHVDVPDAPAHEGAAFDEYQRLGVRDQRRLG